MSFLLPSCEEIPPESLPAFDSISSPKSSMPASEPFISKGTVEHSSNCEFLLKIYHFLSFWKSLSSTKLTYTPNALRYLRTNLSLNADVSENTLPFVSQSINNFSDYDISQSDDWECPSLSPNVLLTLCITLPLDCWAFFWFKNNSTSEERTLGPQRQNFVNLSTVVKFDVLALANELWCFPYWLDCC